MRLISEHFDLLMVAEMSTVKSRIQHLSTIDICFRLNGYSSDSGGDI